MSSRWAGIAVVAARLAAFTPSATAASCPDPASILVPGAEMQKAACLGDLTTSGTTRTGHTNQSDWDGLHASGTRNPSGVPGLQIDGYFPDSSTTNSNNGWFHDSQYATRPQAVKDAVAVVHVVAALDRVEAVHRAAAGVAHEPGVDFAVVADREKGVRRFPDRLRPILPCQRSVFAALERWVERGGQPPPTQFVGKPTSGEVVNRCALALR